MPLPSSTVQAIPLDGSQARSSSPCSQSQPQPHHDRIVLCIGGQILQTSRQTLCVDGDSMLAAWVLRHLPQGDQMLWIDRDARRFHHVLNYLRNGTIWLDDEASLRAVQEEASFFGLTGLENLCEERIQALRSTEEALCKRKKEELREAITEAIREAVSGFCRDPFINPRSKGEVLAVLRGRRLGTADGAASEPVFQMDEDF